MILLVSSASSACLCLIICIVALVWGKLVLMPWLAKNDRTPTVDDIVEATKDALSSDEPLAPEVEQALETGVSAGLTTGSTSSGTQNADASATSTTFAPASTSSGTQNADASATSTTSAPASTSSGTQNADASATSTTSAPKLSIEKAAEFIDNNKGMIIGTSIQIGIPVATLIAKRVAPRAAKQLASKVVGKVSTKITMALAMTATKVLAKLGVNMGVKALQRFGMMAATKLAAGTATAGPLGTAVIAVELAIEAAMMALDFADAGGYLKMGTKKEYLETRKEIVEQIKKAYADNSLTYPSVAGPLDKLDQTMMNDKITQIMTDMMSDPQGTLMKPIMDAAIAKAVARGFTSEADMEAFITAEVDANMPDTDKAWDLAYAKLCTDNGGKLDGDTCSWATKDACDKSYTWPLAENDTYVEWRNNRCEVAPSNMRLICEANQLPYDDQTSICKIDETYCKTKGADWTWDNDLQDYDCKINMGQDIFENIFGTTVVRGLKQIFDPVQFEKCNAGEFDDVYTCRKVDCPTSHPDRDKVTGLCYKPCEAGWHKAGCCLCEQDCLPGWTDRGATCDKKECPADRPDNQGGLCYQACPAGYVGNGPVCWEQGKPGEVNDGAACRVPNETFGNGVGQAKSKQPCPSGMRDDGTSCYADTKTSASHVPSRAPCGAGERDDGTSCWNWGRIVRPVWERPLICNEGEELIASVCYAACPPGHHRSGVLCEPDGGPGIKVNLAQRLFCPAGTTDIGGLCYKNCPDGWEFNGGSICHKVGTGVSRTKRSQGRGTGVTEIRTMAKETPRGAGVGAIPLGTTVRGKKRIVPFSSKTN